PRQGPPAKPIRKDPPAKPIRKDRPVRRPSERGGEGATATAAQVVARRDRSGLRGTGADRAAADPTLPPPQSWPDHCGAMDAEPGRAELEPDMELPRPSLPTKTRAVLRAAETVRRRRTARTEEETAPNTRRSMPLASSAVLTVKEGFGTYPFEQLCELLWFWRSVAFVLTLRVFEKIVCDGAEYWVRRAHCRAFHGQAGTLSGERNGLILHTEDGWLDAVKDGKDESGRSPTGPAK
ncbi:hypothetical protein THAOC_06127, partial [Thalassiosira oceanica]